MQINIVQPFLQNVVKSGHMYDYESLKVQVQLIGK